MTQEEANKIQALTSALLEMKTKVEVLIATTEEGFKHVKEICDERHGLRPGRLARLEQEVAADRIEVVGFREKLKGIVAPVAVIVALLAVLIDFVK